METFYKHMNNFIWQHPFIKGCIHFTSRFCPYMVIIFYSLFLLKIYIEWQSHLFFFIKNPLYSILIVIVLKLIINRKRPIQKYNIKPVDDLKRRNYSFPSIQVAPNMGLLLSTLAVALTISRFLSGVHYLSDVIVSICIAFAINMIFI